MTTTTVPLTEALILQKTKAESLTAVRNLNLWGSDINNDLSVLRRLPNLEILALSVNFVSSLKDLAECKALKELYLRKNHVTALGEMQHLSGLTQLKTLWLCDNPCATHHLYRMYAVRCCPGLKQLDSAEVTDAERQAAKAMTPAMLQEAARANVVAGGASDPSKAQASPPSADGTPQVSPARGGGMPPPTLSKPPQQQNPPALVSNPAQQQQQQQQGQARPSHQAPPTSSVALPNNQPRPSSQPLGSVPPAPPPPPPPTSSSRQVQKSIVSAMLTLMNELSPESLEFLRSDIDDRLRSLRGQ